MSDCKQYLSAAGLREIAMQNECLKLVIQADAGGKISDLIDSRSGRNWLWRNPEIPLGRAQYDVDYGRKLDSGGWDEVLLSLAPSELTFGDGLPRQIPDHGDVVGQPWKVQDLRVTAAGDAVCEMEVAGRALRYQFRRTIELRHDSAHLDIRYSLKNTDAFSLPWYWSMHALLAAEPGLEIELPADQDYRIESAGNEIDTEAALRQTWPNLPAPDGSRYNMARLFDQGALPGPFASKIFVRSPASGLVSIVASDTNERLRIRYDPADLPWLGLWLNNGGWSGCDSDPYVNLGVEPSTIGYDCVTRAVDDGSLTWIQPGETRTWALSLEITG